jgi:hypothetical protein
MAWWSSRPTREYATAAGDQARASPAAMPAHNPQRAHTTARAAAARLPSTATPTAPTAAGVTESGVTWDSRCQTSAKSTSKPGGQSTAAPAGWLL